MPKTTDDRNQPCRVARLTNRQLAWRAVGIRALTQDEQTKQEQKLTINSEVGVAFAGGLLGWVLWSGVLMPISGLKGTFLYNAIIPSVSAIVVSLVFWFFSLTSLRTLKFKKISQLYLNKGVCAACGYSLKDLTVEHDQCIVCPECRAAWKVERLPTDFMSDLPQEEVE